MADNQGGFGVSEHKLTAELIYENPVLYRDVLEYGEHKIGYLVYASFDAAFDGELLDALQAFKDAGINDLILDLRLNGTVREELRLFCRTILRGAATRKGIELIDRKP